MPDILARIVETKHRELEALRPRAHELRDRARDRPSPRDLRGALRPAHGRVALVAEVKRRSPGAGAIRPELDPVTQARAYEAGGAAALSVLTDKDYFQGSLADLTAVGGSVRIPVLRKDFLIDPVQVWEARAAGADAILLIVRILDDGPLRELRELAESLGMAALVEAHDETELDRALASGAGIVGINNRDLRTFRTDLAVTRRLAPRVAPEVILVSESGISTPEQVAEVGAMGADAVLVGESLVRAPDPTELARSLAAQPRSGRATSSGARA
ncbi:MAG: indole-3-glycerol phosphate synthase TrpC [Gemmatimonadales bacterium]|nr:MAG: indole-3-glycerol phosphate synthase TrpC [Gemmatimonadales bacterium]